MNPFVCHLQSAIEPELTFPPGGIYTLHADRPLWVRYDLKRLRSSLDRDAVARRTGGLWKYRELLPLPLDAEPVSLGETATPLLPCPRLGQQLGLSRLWIKDESRLPTGSFKARGMTVAVSMARHLGITRLALPTAGNAGGAAAAYAARAGLEVFVFMPHDTPLINQIECWLAGATVFLVDGLINDCGRIVRQGAQACGWFDLSTLKEPYRLEGKKTMGLELAEQLGWRLPDVILYPTGGGTGLIGMGKAFDELHQLGWLEDEHRPRFISCQADGCAPIAQAFQSGLRHAPTFPNPHTVASGLRVPVAVGDFMILDTIRASGGLATTGREESIVEWMHRAASAEGISLCPESAICLDVLARLRQQGAIGADEQVVVFNTAAAQKYPEAVSLTLPRLSKDGPFDWQAIGLSGPRELPLE
ncbi:MAG: threonine synthase [Gemmataceae bacterium]